MKYARPRMMCKKIPKEGKDISTFNEAEISRLQGWQKKMRLEALRKEKSRDETPQYSLKISFLLSLLYLKCHKPKNLSAISVERL
jgi:hypothetical protein